MTNFEFLQKYLHLQNNVMYDRLDDLGFALVSFCQKDPSPFWNLALVTDNLNADQLSQIELKLSGLGRKPAVYFEGNESSRGLVDLLTKSSYHQINEDSWMFYESDNIDQSHFGSVKPVTTEQDLEVFLKTFDACYQKDDPQNPYGKLGSYLQVARDAWLKHSSSGRLHYYLVFKENQPVAVSTLNNYSGIGYISNVGSLRSVRGQGYGKVATLYCVKESQKAGNQTHCLATEEGTYPNKFYSQIGFSTRFRAPLWTKA